VPSTLLDPTGHVPFRGKRRGLDDPPALGAHLDTRCPSLGSTVSVIARPVVRASPGEALLPGTGWCRPLRHPSHPRAWGWRAV
jgi:hypothetical protein